MQISRRTLLRTGAMGAVAAISMACREAKAQPASAAAVEPDDRAAPVP